MPDQLPSGRWRARIHHPRTGKRVLAHTIIGGPATHPDEKGARQAERAALRHLHASTRAGASVGEFWTEWTTQAPWLRPAESTNLHNRERTAKFAERYWDRPIRSIGDDDVREWLKGNANLGTVPALRAFFNDAMKARAGRLVEVNPFANLGLRQSKGRRNVQPPSQVESASLVEIADEFTPPSFAAYLHFEMYEGTRPGEADILRWDRIDFTAKTVRVDAQWNAKTREETLPKHGVVRTIALTEPAEKRLLSLPRESEFVFTTLRGGHYTPSARSHHWNRVRCAAGLGQMDLYTATRHYFAWYAWNVLELTPEDIAAQLGHQDGGQLVRELYGHFDYARSRARVRAAFEQAPAQVSTLRRVDTA